MTADEYYALASTFDQRKIDEQIARIPWNVNRAGKHYKKLIKEIYETRRPGCQPRAGQEAKRVGSEAREFVLLVSRL